MNKPYRPHADSLASQVIAFFKSNPGETLLLDDITVKFDASRHNIHTQLAAAVAALYLVRGVNDDTEYTYQAGSKIKDCTTEPAAPALPKGPNSAFPAKRTSSAPKMVDIDALVVETGIPYTRGGTKGEGKWDGLFKKLKAKGQSTKFAGEAKSAVASAALKYNKTNPGAYRVAMVSKTEARVWRTA
jgi:hypothetical protein